MRLSSRPYPWQHVLIQRCRYHHDPIHLFRLSSRPYPCHHDPNPEAAGAALPVARAGLAQEGCYRRLRNTLLLPPHPVSFALSHPHTHTHSLALSISHNLPPTHIVSLSRSLTHPHTHILSLSRSRTHTRPHAFSRSLTLSFSLSNASSLNLSAGRCVHMKCAREREGEGERESECASMCVKVFVRDRGGEREYSMIRLGLDSEKWKEKRRDRVTSLYLTCRGGALLSSRSTSLSNGVGYNHDPIHRFRLSSRSDTCHHVLNLGITSLSFGWQRGADRDAPPGRRDRGRDRRDLRHGTLTLLTLHPTHYTLHTTHYTLHITPYTLHTTHTHYALHSTPASSPKPSLSPEACSLQPWSLNLWGYNPV